MPVRKQRALGIIALSMIVIGFFSVILFKGYYKDSQEPRPQDASLPNLLQLELENEQLAKENEKLWKDLTGLQAGQSAAALASEQLNQAKMNAGLIKLTGPGLIITLDDSQLERDQEYGNYVIHEEYLRTLVNILWNGGAEAIAINDQRITTHTEIFCSGAYIQINGTRQMPPYRIVAIGDQDNLESALQFYFWDKLGEYQQQYGITRKLDVPAEPLTVPAGEERSYRFVQPLKEG